jgi:DNA-binding XRE family transcriptional regulator
MNAPETHVVVKDDNGTPTHVVIPYNDYLETYIYRNNLVPAEVVDYMLDNEVSRVRAWRHYRKMTQKMAAEAMGITQGAYSQIENTGKPQEGTLKKLALVFNISVEQLIG